MTGSGAHLYFSSGHVVDAVSFWIIGRVPPGVPARDPGSSRVYMVGAGAVRAYSDGGEVLAVSASYRVPRRAEVWEERGAVFVLSCGSTSHAGYHDCDSVYSVGVD